MTHEGTELFRLILPYMVVDNGSAFLSSCRATQDVKGQENKQQEDSSTGACSVRGKVRSLMVHLLGSYGFRIVTSIQMHSN